MKTTASDILIDAIHDWGVDASMKQAEKFAESLLRGEPNRGKIISTVAEDRVRELV